ncbi:hypothetical protein AAEU28_11925 [Pseudoalteromonas sp. SS15]|uniref:hypothetical protein n=1 Tax=Pseudoalteromonas sp. SS15 TaxID=3139393 RepID=UPI003BAD3402
MEYITNTSVMTCYINKCLQTLQILHYLQKLPSNNSYSLIKLWQTINCHGQHEEVFHFFLILIWGIIIFSIDEQTLDGCYASSAQITDLTSGLKTSKTSYINISKSENGYLVNGLIWGANFHVCEVFDENGPLLMLREGNLLKFSYDEPDYGINCSLKITIKDEQIEFNDPEHACSKNVFFCGSRISLDEITLSKIKSSCPTGIVE